MGILRAGCERFLFFLALSYLLQCLGITHDFVLACAGAQQREITYSAEVTGLSRYFFRGRQWYRGASIQPKGKVAYPISKRSDLEFSLASQLPLQGEREGREFIEVDYSAFYRTKAGPATLMLGTVGYGFLEGEPPPPGNTGELALKIYFDAVLTPGFELYQDIDETHSRYFEMNFRQEVAYGNDDRFVFSPFLRLGYAFHVENDVYGSGGFNHLALGLESEFSWQELSFIPFVTYIHQSDRRVSEGGLVGLSVRF